jgi:acetyltransferase-like isoleucine patch superfamily enzyme
MPSLSASFEKLFARVHASRRHVDIGGGVRIHPLASVKVVHGGSIAVGTASRLHRGVILATYGGAIEIGANSTVNPYCVLYGHGGLRIGNFVRIATHCVFVPANHGFERLDVPIAKQPVSARGIVIQDDVWIGANCVILDGVTIGTGAVVGAGAVVTRSIEPFSICVGNPARVIRSRRAQPAAL